MYSDWERAVEFRLDVIERILRDLRETLREIDELLERFEESILKGTLGEAFERLEARMRMLEEAYPPARAYRERAELLKRYVEALRVRVSLYGLRRNYFREVEYIEKHFKDIMDFVEGLSLMIKASRRTSL